jgi:hypothetical protein
MTQVVKRPPSKYEAFGSNLSLNCQKRNKKEILFLKCPITREIQVHKKEKY